MLNDENDDKRLGLQVDDEIVEVDVLVDQLWTDEVDELLEIEQVVMHELDDNEVLEYVVIDDDEVEVDMVLDEYDVIDDETDEPLLQITDDEVDDETLSILDILEVPDELDANEWLKYAIK